MSSLIKIMNDEPRIGSKILAEGFGIGHPPAQKLIQKYRHQMEEFGKLVEIRARLRKTSTNPNARDQGQLEYFLNEQQATLFGTLTRNSETSVKFKLMLVKEFFSMRDKLTSLGAHQSTEEWQKARIEGKGFRLEQTDAIKKFVEYASTQGSKNAERYYMLLTKMENAALFVVAGKFTNLRDMLSTRQLMTVGVADKIIDNALNDGMKSGLSYKDVYQLAKQRTISFAALYGQSEVVATMLAIEAD